MSDQPVERGPRASTQEVAHKAGTELSFVGCDDVAITDLFQPAVAVIRRDNFAIGRAAAELLLARMRDGAPPSDVVLPTEFVARPSCPSRAV